MIKWVISNHCEREFCMSNTFMRVDDVANELKVSTSYAYKVIKSLNKQLREMGYMTIAGRVSRKYFLEKMCYGTEMKGE